MKVQFQNLTEFEEHNKKKIRIFMSSHIPIFDNFIRLLKKKYSIHLKNGN